MTTFFNMPTRAKALWRERLTYWGGMKAGTVAARTATKKLTAAPKMF